jgi:hypothetical protein
MRRREDGDVNHTWNGKVETSIEQRIGVQDIPCFNTTQGTDILLKGDGVCIALLALR